MHRVYLLRCKARDVFKNGPQFETVGALRQAVFTSSRNISQQPIVPQRIVEVTDNNGGGTHS